jgi:hypothetical protein
VSATGHEIANAAWGDDEPTPVPWSSGPWAIELREDELANIRFDGLVVLRSIRAVVRDSDWGTASATVTSLERTESGLIVDIAMRAPGIEVDARITVEAGVQGLAVSLSALALTEFWSNRLGLVLLHPPTVAGSPLVVVAPDGGRTETAFPRGISPHQPAFDIARLEWMSGGIESSLEFAGDTFEMEDQRNWTDASFKTYSTPLALPFPVQIRAGTRIEQSIVLRSERVGRVERPAQEPAITMIAAGRPVPSLSLLASTSPGERSVPADALLVELDAGTDAWRTGLESAALEARGLPLDVRIVANEAVDVDAILDAIAGARLTRVGVYSATTHVTEPGLWRALLDGVARRGITADLVGGARSHFTELNREHERLPSDIPALTFSMTPQVHTTSRHQLVESIAIQRLAAQDAVRIAGGRPVHVGPVTLRPRFSAVARSSVEVPTTVAAPEPLPLDSRQASDAMIAWTIASAAALAIDGVASICYFEAWGRQGLGADHPYPVATAIRWLHELAGADLFVPASELPEGVWAIGGEVEGRVVVLVSNLGEAPASLLIEAGRTPVVVEPVVVEPFGAVRLTL